MSEKNLIHYNSLEEFKSASDKFFNKQHRVYIGFIIGQLILNKEEAHFRFINNQWKSKVEEGIAAIKTYKLHTRYLYKRLPNKKFILATLVEEGLLVNDVWKDKDGTNVDIKIMEISMNWNELLDSWSRTSLSIKGEELLKARLLLKKPIDLDLISERGMQIIIGAFKCVCSCKYNGKDRALVIYTGEPSTFRREVLLWLCLKHPNIVTAYGVHEKEYGVFVLTEHCNGGTLEDYLKYLREKNQVTREIQFQLIDGLLKGLTYLHNLQIYHSNLKPRNVFIKNGNVKLGNFGSSKQMKTLLASTFVGEGTIRYTDPLFDKVANQKFSSNNDEIYKSEDENKEVSNIGNRFEVYAGLDMYSAACTIIYILFSNGTKQREVWNNYKSVIDICKQKLKSRYPPELKELENLKIVPANIIKLLRRCFDDSVDKRPSAAEMRDEFRDTFRNVHTPNEDGDDTEQDLFNELKKYIADEFYVSNKRVDMLLSNI